MPRPRTGPGAAGREAEIKVYGQHACRALFARRPDDVLRVYLTRARTLGFGDLLGHCARAHRPYRVVEADELEKLTDSRHHEGICVVARPRRPATLGEVLRAPGAGFLIALADVGNPHNLGAVLRTAAHFGARAVLLSGAGARVGPAAARTAQGGAEALDVIGAERIEEALAACRAAGFTVCATSSRGGRDLFAGPLPGRAVLLLGAEGEGLPRPLMERADLVLSIPGTGAVESLNVAAAAAVVMAELWRQRRGRPR